MLCNERSNHRIDSTLRGVHLDTHFLLASQLSDSPDDRAVFADIKTTWVIEGLCHGHQNLARPEAASAVLRREGNKVIGNASVVQYNVITPENIDSFHFHGDRQEFPITAVIALPRDHKSGTLLMGRYQSPDDPSQIVKPLAVMDDLLATIRSRLG